MLRPYSNLLLIFPICVNVLAMSPFSPPPNQLLCLLLQCCLLCLRCRPFALGLNYLLIPPQPIICLEPLLSPFPEHAPRSLILRPGFSEWEEFCCHVSQAGVNHGISYILLTLDPIQFHYKPNHCWTHVTTWNLSMFFLCGW